MKSPRIGTLGFLILATMGVDPHPKCDAQASDRPAYIKYHAYHQFQTLAENRQRAEKVLTLLEQQGIQGRVVVDGDNVGALLLLGPYTTREFDGKVFDAKEAAIQARLQLPESGQPYYLPSDKVTAADPASPSPPAGNEADSPSAKLRNASPTAEETASWVTDFIKEKGGVLQAIRIDASGATSDASRLFDFRKDGLVFNWGQYASVLGSSASVIIWKDVRTINALNNGWIDIWATIRIKNISNPISRDSGTTVDEGSALPAHLRFVLANSNPADNIRFVNALYHLAELNGAHYSPSSIY